MRSASLLDSNQKVVSMPNWEYLILETAFKTERANVRMMNDYGAQGWEMTAAFPTPDAASVTMYFKRPAQANS